MKLVKEILYEKFSEDSDSIQDMGIGMAHHFKDIFDNFGKADKQQYIYTIVINNDNIDFWFDSKEIQKESIKVKNGLFNYVKNHITNLGYDSALKNPEVYNCYYRSVKETLPRIVRYKLKRIVQGIIKDREYRRELPERNITFVPYGKVSDYYEKEATLEEDE